MYTSPIYVHILPHIFSRIFPLRYKFFLFVLQLFSPSFHAISYLSFYILPFSTSFTKHPIIFFFYLLSVFFQIFLFPNLELILKRTSSFLKFRDSSLFPFFYLYLFIYRYNSSLTIILRLLIRWQRVSNVKSSPSKNLRISWEEELRLYISFDELKSMEGTGSGVATGCSRQEETKLKEQGSARKRGARGIGEGRQE